jgi:hypothetical protein
MGSATSRDNSLYKSQLVKCYSPSGTFIDVVRDAPFLSGFTEAVNAATSSITVTLPRRIDAYDGANMPSSRGTVALGNIWKWYLFGPGLPATGLLRYQGIVDTIRPHVDDDGGEALDVTITPYSSILGDHAIVGPITYGTAGSPGTYVDSGTMLSSLWTTTDPITSKAYGIPFALDPTNPATTGISVASIFQNQSLLSALTTILLLSPTNYFFRMNDPLLTLGFNQYPTTANYTLVLGQHISSMEYSLDNVPRKNMIFVQGNGTVSAKAVGTSVATIGERTYFKSDGRITDVNTAQQLANGLLSFYDRTQVRTKVRIPDYRGDAQPGIGFDIEQFRVGQTVQIIDQKAPAAATSAMSPPWGSFVWGHDVWGSQPNDIAVWGQFHWGQTAWGFSVGSVFNSPVPIVAIHYDFFGVELELGFRQPSMLRALYDLESRFNDTTLVS